MMKSSDIGRDEEKSALNGGLLSALGETAFAGGRVVDTRVDSLKEAWKKTFRW